MRSVQHAKCAACGVCSVWSVQHVELTACTHPRAATKDQLPVTEGWAHAHGACSSCACSQARSACR